MLESHKLRPVVVKLEPSFGATGEHRSRLSSLADHGFEVLRSSLDLFADGILFCKSGTLRRPLVLPVRVQIVQRSSLRCRPIDIFPTGVRVIEIGPSTVMGDDALPWTVKTTQLYGAVPVPRTETGCT